MIESSRMTAVLRWIPPIFNGVYKVLVLAALIWIGVCLQEVADAIYSSRGEACAVDPDAGDSSDDNAPSGVIKPLLRGTL